MVFDSRNMGITRRATFGRGSSRLSCVGRSYQAKPWNNEFRVTSGVATTYRLDPCPVFRIRTRRSTRTMCPTKVNAFWGRMFSSAQDGNESNNSSFGDSSQQQHQQNHNVNNKKRRDALLEYVSCLSPATHRISDPMVPKMSVVAIRQTVGNLIGTLPPEYFEITISSREENLMQLMYSVLMTGYMFCNAHHRFELAKRLEIASPKRISQSRLYKNGFINESTSASLDDMYYYEDGQVGPGAVQSSSRSNAWGQKGFLPDVSVKKKERSSDCVSDEEDIEDDVEYIGEDAGVFAAGTQKVGIQGDVLRWHYEHGVQQIPASEYIDQLEQEVAALRLEISKLSNPESLDNDEPSQEQDVNQTDIALARLAYYTRSQKTNAPISANTMPRGYQVEQDPTSVLAEELESELLAYLKTLSSEHVAELTECASADVMEAMNVLVDRLIGKDNQDGIWTGSRKSQCTSSELGEILFWLMGVGHQLRDMEIRLSLTNSLQSIPSFGPDDGIDEYPDGFDIAPQLPPGK